MPSMIALEDLVSDLAVSRPAQVFKDGTSEEAQMQAKHDAFPAQLPQSSSAGKG